MNATAVRAVPFFIRLLPDEIIQMVDRVHNKFDPTSLQRVNAARDALEEEKDKGGQDEEDGEGKEDGFDALAEKKNWQVLFDKNSLWKRNIELKVDEIQSVKILGVNIQSDPSLVKMRVFMKDGSDVNTAFMSVSRSVAIKLKGEQRATITDLSLLTKDLSLRVTIPQDEKRVDEEITRITKAAKEVTLSETMKSFISNKTWLERLGFRDPVTKSINTEIIWIYLTIVGVISVLVVGVSYLMF